MEPTDDRQQTNISLFYTDSRKHQQSQALASFLVPSFVGEWTQFALKVHGNFVTLYHKCVKFASIEVRVNAL